MDARGRLCAAALVGALLSAVPATADARGTGAQGTYSISPASTQLIGRSPLTLSPTAVTNSTGTPLAVTVIPVLLRQKRTGAFAYATGPAARRRARRVLATSIDRFTLDGHDRRTVLTRWISTDTRRPTYVGVLYRAVPVRASASSVHTVEQLLAIDLLGVPGAAPADLRVRGASFADGSATRLRATVSVGNLGQTFGSPRSVVLRLRNQRGAKPIRLALTPGVILPGVTRDFSALLPTRLAGGRYTATATVRAEGHVTRRTVSLRVGPDGLLPAPSFVAGTVHAAGTAGHPATVSVPVHNAGSERGVPRASVALYEIHDGVRSPRPVASVALGGGALATGRDERLAATLGRLARGSYAAVVRYRAPFSATQPSVVTFTALSPTSTLHRTLRWVRHRALVLALAAALAGTLAVSGGRRLRPRRPRPAAPEPVRLHPLPSRPEPIRLHPLP